MRKAGQGQEMEQIKVSEIASEFDLQYSVVISELKKIGVWVPTANTLVDHDIANRIRRRLQLILEIEQEEETKSEKTKEKKKTTPSPARKTIKELGKPRKTPRKVEEETPEESPLASSLKPRKGKASYRRITVDEEVVPEKTEVTIDDEPVIEKVEAQVSAELLEQVMQQPTPEDLEALTETPRKVGEKAGPPEERKVEPEVTAPGKVKEEPSQVETEPPAVTKAKVKELTKTPSVKERAKPPKKKAAEQAASQAVQEEPKAPTVKEPAEKPAEVTPAAEAAAAPEAPAAAAMELREITLPETVTVKELGEKLAVKSKDILKELLNRGAMASINQSLDRKTLEEICAVFNAIPRFVSFEEAVIEETQVEDRAEDLVPRAPVVTVMGHVDHGKTSLLDVIRKTEVAAGEAGGITQHIGAYHINIKNRRIVFLDTPGHEAFTLMRARGAQVTDIVVLVIAADDGVMPQTGEAIDHARAAGVPIVVAINKIDKPEAQVERVRQQLSEYELVAEDWGGDTVMVEVSAKEKANLDLLLEMILLVADMRELKANPKRLASGVILEARLDKGRGAVATVLVQNGLLQVGDSFIAGAAYGKIRAMFGDRGQPVVEAGPSSAVEILGLQGMPQAGDSLQAVDDTLKARQIGEYRQEKLREQQLSRSARVNLDELYTQMQSGEIKELPVVLKADGQGSVEVLEDTLQKLSTEKVKIHIIHSGVGGISESDVLLATASNAIVIGFNVRLEQNAQATAEHEGVDVRLYDVIYNVSDEIEQAMLGLLEPTIQETYQGRAEVRETFRVSKFGTIAGSYVQDGVINRNAETRLIRDDAVAYEGKIDSLRRFKKDVKQVKAGQECGISLANFKDIKIGDVIEAFVKEKVEPQLTG